MVLKVTVQEQSSKQSLCKVSSESFFKLNFLKSFETGKHLCWSLFLINNASGKEISVRNAKRCENEISIFIYQYTYILFLGASF